MMTQPLVTVVTPSFNRCELIEGTIRSVGAQDYPNIEHIVVDGGSSDGTLDTLRQLETEFPKMRWMSEADSGMYDAINKGHALGIGSVCAYLNTDDRYFPWTVGVAVAALARFEDVDFVYGDALSVYPAEPEGRVFFAPAFRRTAFLRSGGVISQPSVFWKRSAHDRSGVFDTTLQLAGDFDFWLRLATHGSGRKIDEVLSFELDHPENLRRSRVGELNNEIRLVRDRYAPSTTTAPGVSAQLDRAATFLAKRRRQLKLAGGLKGPPRSPSLAKPYSYFLKYGAELGFVVSVADLWRWLPPQRSSRLGGFVSVPGPNSGAGRLGLLW